MWYIPIKNTMLSELVKTSPVSVNFVSEVSILPSTTNAITIGGFLSKHDGRAKACIEVLNSLSEHQKIATLLHEIGHAKCSKKKCKCRTTQSAEGEIHANEYTLSWLLKNKHKKILKIAMRHIKDNSDRTDYYGEAAKCIMDSKLWQKCLKYVGKL